MLSMIVSWKNRKELGQSIHSLVDTAAYLGGELIIVNFDGDTAIIEQVMAPLNCPDINIVHVLQQSLFNKAAANNLGAFHARYDYLFFCDCDIILEPTTLATLFEKVREAPDRFGTLEGVKETIVNSIQNNHIISFGYEMIVKTKDGRVLRIVDAEEDANDGTRNAPGLLMVPRTAFEYINGYNARLIGWGWEDQDMISRLTLGAGLHRQYSGHAMHISHDDKERTKHYPIANRWESRDKMFRQALANYDANNFQGTYSNDITNYVFTSRHHHRDRSPR